MLDEKREAQCWIARTNQHAPTVGTRKHINGIAPGHPGEMVLSHLKSSPSQAHSASLKACATPPSAASGPPIGVYFRSTQGLAAVTRSRSETSLRVPPAHGENIH